MSAERPPHHVRNGVVGVAVALSLGAIGLVFFGAQPAPPAWNPPAAAAIPETAEVAAVPAPPAVAVAAPETVAALPAAARAAVPALRRGVNLSRPLSFSSRDPGHPGKYLWPPFQGDLTKLSDAELDRLRSLGFDFVRLPVDPGPFMEADSGELDELFALMRTWVERLRGHGLSVLLDMHPTNSDSNWTPREVLADPNGEKFAAYTEFLTRVASTFADQPTDAFAFELMNEPQGECDRKDGEDWTVSQKRLFDAVRTVAPDMPLVLIGACWGSPDGLMRVDPGQYDAATIYDFHFYEPYYFSHQSISWASPPARYIAGLTWPAASGSLERTTVATKNHIARMEKTSGTLQVVGAFASALKEISYYYGKLQPGPATVAARFDQITQWAGKHDIAPERIVMGEFSAIRWPDGVADDGSRLRWIADVRKAAEDHGFGWALWDYNEGFGLLADNATRTVDGGTAEALGLDLQALKP